MKLVSEDTKGLKHVSPEDPLLRVPLPPECPPHLPGLRVLVNGAAGRGGKGVGVASAQKVSRHSSVQLFNRS